MHFTLRDYQDEAARDCIKNLRMFSNIWQDYGTRNAFALSAPTGSGKTIIAASVIESIMQGNDEYGIEADPKAVFLWISKDPSLNAQTKHRFTQAAQEIPTGNLVILDNSYTSDRLHPGHVYFINPAKLSKTALFVKKSDNRQHTFWDVLANTVNDPMTRFYVVLDEAHEGVRPPRKSDAENDRSIVMRILEGNGTNPPVPVVWGISATPERFHTAMEGAARSIAKPGVVVDPLRVQESGLIKKTLAADIPDESGFFETTFVRKAAVEFNQVCRRWDEYGQTEQLKDSVLPLIIIQIPNKSKADDGFVSEDAAIATYLDVVRQNWPGFTDDCIAHVLGDRGTIQAGPFIIPHIAPEDVQETHHIRVLIAKDAISTGWDCPRAEVLVSLRPGEDVTYITQLLGRMLRTPLARETSDNRLNSASVYLPRFNRDHAAQVVKHVMGLTGGILGGSDGGVKVLFKPTDLAWNQQVPAEVKALIEQLPSLPKPAAAPKPITRLYKAASAFAHDKLIEDATEQANKHLLAVLDGINAQYRDRMDAATVEVLAADVRTITGTLLADDVEDTVSQVTADKATVVDAWNGAKRAINTTVINAWLRREILRQTAGDGLATDGSVVIADEMKLMARAAAFGRVVLSGSGKSVKELLEDAADQLVRDWFDAHRVTIRELSDSRKSVYDDIRTQARGLEQSDTEVKEFDLVDTVDKNLKPLPLAKLHLLSDSDGLWPVEEKMASNSWEMAVLRRELGADLAGNTSSGPLQLVGWYRNPSSGKSALRIAYLDGTRLAGQPPVWKSVQPDFIFVHSNPDGVLRPSIIDPHGTHLSDARNKLGALSSYAAVYGDKFARIDSVAAVGVAKPGEAPTLKVLDLLDEAVRDAIHKNPGMSAAELFTQYGTPY